MTSIGDTGSRKDMAQTQQILVLHDSLQEAGRLLFANSARALHDARIGNQAIDLAEIMSLPELGGFSAIIVCAESLDRLGYEGAVALADYVAGGGGLVLNRCRHAELAEAAGIEQGAARAAGDMSDGLRIVDEMLGPFAGIELDEVEFGGHGPLDLTPAPTAVPLAENAGGRPIAWFNRHGKGRVVYWNSASLRTKRMRGLLIQSLMAVQPAGVLPAAAIATIQIDDFPAPLWHDDMGPVADEFPGITPTEFYSTIWHPDMCALAARHGVVYTYLPAFNYNDRVTPPFGFEEWCHPSLELGGATVRQTVHEARKAAGEGELGLHGYNHLSLTSDIWASAEAIRAALRAVRDRWRQDGLGSLPTSYVPPNNAYDALGVTALTEAMPSLRVISGSYFDLPFERGGQREYGPEPWNPALFAIPRATSGYERKPDMMFDAISQIATAGIWTHFVHADDVFDLPEEGTDGRWNRNPTGRPWRGRPDPAGGGQGLLDEFEAWIAGFAERFPWLRFARTSDALPVLERHLASDWRVEFGPSAIRITTTAPDLYFHLRLSDRRKLDARRLAGADLVSTASCRSFDLHTLRTTAAEVEIGLALAPEEPPGPALHA